VTALAQAFQELLAALDRTVTRFVVVGSVASGAHGLARLTNDIDILIDLPADRAPALCAALRPHFYVDADRISRALNWRAAS
jgi:predicted nucleotidyltransferase